MEENEMNKYRKSERERRIKSTNNWQAIGIIVVVLMFVMGIVLGKIQQVYKMTYESPISEEYNTYEYVFNTELMFYCWGLGLGSYLVFQAVNSICYRLDLIIDK